MELFLRKGREFERLYNCSLYDVDQIPLGERQNIPLGIMFTLIGVVEEILYVPCMVVIWRLSRADNPCYKLMFLMGLLDMACLWICAIGTGVFLMRGSVYCSQPALIYVLGSLAIGLWIAESSVEIVLAVNRCIEVLFEERFAKALFDGWRIWPWMFCPLAYGIYNLLFQKPVLFNAVYASWFFNPHIGYNISGIAQETYENTLHGIHNFFVLCALCGTYGLFTVALLYKICLYRSAIGAENTNQHKTIFLQVVVISVINGGAASLYVYMQNHAVSKYLIVTAQFLWTQAHGIPPVIYLAMNRTIRNECFKLFKRKASVAPRPNRVALALFKHTPASALVGGLLLVRGGTGENTGCRENGVNRSGKYGERTHDTIKIESREQEKVVVAPAQKLDPENEYQQSQCSSKRRRKSSSVGIAPDSGICLAVIGGAPVCGTNSVPYKNSDDQNSN